MKRTPKTIIKAGFGALLLSVISLSVFAQKLNTVQEGSVLAPANIKVDGKLTEWNDTFQAYSKTTNVYYTMANDADNLYLVMKSVDQSNNNKIIGGGINLTINTAGKKSEKDAFALIFPVVNLMNLRNTMMQGMSMTAMRSGGGAAPQAPDSEAIAAMRKKAVSTFKEVKLVGFKDIPDSVISIYNEYGIKAFVDFDNKGALIIEMAVPLKQLNITAGSAFSYNIKLNGINLNAIMPGMGSMMMGGGMGGGGASFSGGGAQTVTVVSSSSMGGGGGMPRGMGDIANMLSPTDFWGKYTLAKKE
ncbi:MAG: hypothetical protein V4592_13690 [Bacteroidota bacterium]